MPKYRTILMMGAAFGLSLGILAADVQAAEIKRGGTITVARSDEALTLDPFVPSDNGSIYNITQICESLISADATGAGLEPGLAESWTSAPDGLSIELKLRDGVKFSNGNPLTVEDVIFSLNKVADPKGSFGFIFDPVKSIEKAGDNVVRLTFKQPYAALDSALSLFAASIVSKADYEKDPTAFGSKPVCTGPFTVESYERGTQAVLAANPHYWRMGVDGKPLPYVDKAILKYVPESNSRVLGLQNGDFDVALAVPLNQAEAVKAMEGVVLEVIPSFRLDYVYLNHAKKPLDDKRIRLALNYAANRDAIMKAVYFGYGEIPNSYMPKVTFWSDKVAKIPFDIEKAKQLVQEAGYDGTPIQVMVDTGDAPFRAIATILQQGWKQAGLNVDIVEFDVGTAFSMTQKGDYQAYVSYITSDINDDDELASIQADGTGATASFFSNYKNDEVTKLLAEARQTSDKAKRAELYGKVQEIVYNDGYSVPVNFRPYVNGHRDYVQNWRNLSTGWWWLRDVWLNK
ncbi:ABC transporter substrate-binding protein [Nordella sp. HKS 07]|uniref:ABC transporter substrate-binding protein n=1 Tax=Nordella sp. HKS 07 TaxID=2712222 RepID=UPI0013E184EB|nr:ABC transporter substrate-binding protein [Nordella sp. HKS 07]QIG51793.1 ABC transporter substrate-binding protein [Nordella sp. HKS 07]